MPNECIMPAVSTTLLLASQNPGKLAEMRVLLEGLPFVVSSPRDLGILESPDETGASFAENAALKARWYSQRAGLPAIADDSGISVDALDGGPGLYSSRFGGEGASDAERNRLLLQQLAGVPDERRGARFTSAVALVRDGRLLFEATSTVEGRIAHGERGGNGFGYDPLFFYPPFGCTFGEVERALKDRVSHRGQSFAKLREFLAGWPAGALTPSAS